MPVKPIGGTQIVNNYLHEHLDLDGFAIWPTTFDGKEVDPNVINIYHQHLEASLQDMTKVFTEDRMETMDALVFISHWQYEDFLINFPWLDASKCHVIKNATSTFPEPNKSTDGKLKAIYTSTPFRGLKLMPEIWKRLDRDDIELDVYSSLEIYGKNFADKVRENHGSEFDDLFEELDSIPGINYKGYVTNKEVKQACLDAHLYLYPSIIMETSCLSLMEAMAGGCAAVYTNIGALSETGSEYGYPSLMSFDDDKLIDNFVKKTNFVCDNYWTQPVQEKLKRQLSFYRENYSWEVRLKEWEALLKDLKKLKE